MRERQVRFVIPTWMKVYTSASNITTVDFLYKLHSTVSLLMAGLSVVNAISILKILLLLHSARKVFMATIKPSVPALER